MVTTDNGLPMATTDNSKMATDFLFKLDPVLLAIVAPLSALCWEGPARGDGDGAIILHGRVGDFELCEVADLSADTEFDDTFFPIQPHTPFTIQHISTGMATSEGEELFNDYCFVVIDGDVLYWQYI